MRKLLLFVMTLWCAAAPALLSAQAVEEALSARREPQRGLPAVLSRLSLSYELNTLYPKNMDYEYFNGGGVAYNIDFRLSEHRPVYLGTGVALHLVTRSKNSSDPKLYNTAVIRQTTTFINMNLPLDLSVRLPLYPRLTLSPFVGLNWRIQLYGHNRNRIKSGCELDRLDEICREMRLGPPDGNLFSKKDYGSNALNRFQLGWRAGLRLQYRRITLQASYGADFIKLHRQLGSSNLIISLGYSL